MTGGRREGWAFPGNEQRQREMIDQWCELDSLEIKLLFLRLRYFSAKNGGRESISRGMNGTWKDESWAGDCEQGCLPGVKHVSGAAVALESNVTERAMSVRL